MRYSRAQSALGAVSGDRAADPPARRKSHAEGLWVVLRLLAAGAPERRANHLQDQTGHG
jgi:hypothetical protein